MLGNFFSGLLLLILLPSLALSDTTGPSAAEETQFAFANHLLQNHDYYRAATEFKRLLFLYPSGAKADEANYLLGTALFLIKSYKEAIFHWEGVLRQNPDTPFKEEIQYKTGRAYWELGQEDRALLLWEKILQEGRPSQKTFAARSLLWGLIKQKRFDPARLLLKKSPLTDSEKKAHEAFFQKAENLPYKSPATAGTLAAILPGAGHWYLGRKQDALIAFGVNALFTWAAVASFQQDNNGLGTLLGVIELAWYSGNIYSAVNSAHKFNRKLDSDFLEGYGLRFGLLSQGPSSSPIPYLVLHRAF
ncbi:MAG: tetratricopeptide repeat protein [Deltaproteobacteria bacterium]|nr:tetratricopeptide repeat protein [Deltaproteobacteria bacterium]